VLAEEGLGIAETLSAGAHHLVGVPGKSLPLPSLPSLSLTFCASSRWALGLSFGVGTEAGLGVVVVCAVLGLPIVAVGIFATGVVAVVVVAVVAVVAGRLLAGALGVLAPVAVVGVSAAAGLVTVVVTAGGVAPEPPARSTSAAASTPSASTTTTASAPSGRRQPGGAARRVRAAAPQLKHHACSRYKGAPHTGHASPLGAGPGAGVPPPGGCDVAALTSPAAAGRGFQ
jgi:hypothetical protein